jgi:predicted Rossmann fold flavoprotein
VVIDLKPGLDLVKLAGRIQRDLAANSRKKIINAATGLTLGSLVPVVFEASGVDGEKQAAQASKKDMQALARSLKNLEMEFTGFRSFDEAIVTAGGVDVREVDPRTLQSRIVPGLYFAGELLDVHGYTGGYNLHAAFATGYVAGKSCAGEDD